MPIEDTYGTVKFKELIGSLRSEREAEKQEEKEEEGETLAPPETQVETPTTATVQHVTPPAQQVETSVPPTTQHVTYAAPPQVNPFNGSVEVPPEQPHDPFEVQYAGEEAWDQRENPGEVKEGQEVGEV